MSALLRLLRRILHRDEYVSDFSSSTDGYCGHWSGVPQVMYPPSDLVRKYGN